MKKLEDTIKNILKQSIYINEIAMDNSDKLVEMPVLEKLKDIINPIVEAQKIWMDNIEIKNPLKELNIDFSYIEENTKIGCEKMLENGFYPYSNIGTSTCLSIVKEKDFNKIEQILEESVEYNIKKCKSDIISTFSDYAYWLEEIYMLYNEEKYRLCILSIINILSQIFNRSFEYKDFTETNELVLRDYNLMNLSNEQYYQFMPYLIESNEKTKRTDKKYNNTLLCNCKKHKEKYKDIPYNRNAILHGYSGKFGTKTNCLRWFSVLLNTNDIFKENMLNGGK